MLDPQAVPLHIPHAKPTWSLLLQSGVGIACTVGISFTNLLRDELGLNDEQLQPVDAFLLNGMPVDEPDTAIIPDKARIALAAGLPGIAGLALKSGSAVRALRSGITYEEKAISTPCPGTIILSLYSLALPLLGGHILERGVMIEPSQFVRYARFAPDDRVKLGGRILSIAELKKWASAMPKDITFLLTAKLCQK